MDRKPLFTALFLCAFLQILSSFAMAESFAVYEYGFEDDWNGWLHDNPWEISRDDAYNGDFSVHCPVEADLNALLTSPTVQLPDDDWNIFFEFRVHCDAKAFNPNNDNLLDDYFRVELMSGFGAWQDLIYDYGRDAEWQQNWMYYGPGVWFRNDMPEWRVNLDLTQFAGQEIALRWRFITDEDMNGDQGTGIWIDDVRIVASDARQNDVGIEWVRIDYPTTQGNNLSGSMCVTNFGLSDQIRVLKFIQIDRDRRVPIVPWEGLAHISSRIYDIDISANRLTHPGTTHCDFITEIEEDENPLNDTIPADIFIYPPNVWQLGYDDRRGNQPVIFEWGGPAVLFTPESDGVPGDFNISAVEFLWSDEQVQDATAELKISRDNHSEPGEVLYRGNVVVTPADIYPHRQRLDLTEIDALHNLRTDFWVSLVPLREGGYPLILGADDVPRRFNGHYFNFDGARIHEVDTDFQIQAVLTGENTSHPNLVAEPVMNFGLVALDRPKTQKLTVMGGGESPVIIEEIHLESDVFRFMDDPGLPLELAIGELFSFEIICEPGETGIYEADVNFTCNDESPPQVHLTANAGIFPRISVEPAEIDFGMVELGTPNEAVFTITDNGPVELVVSEIIAGNRDFRIEMDWEEIIQPDSDVDFFIVFTPTRIGRIIDTLRIFSDDPYTPQYKLPLRCFVYEEGSPVVENPIDDIRMIEDDEPFSVADLNEVFVDHEGDELVFSAESNRDGLRVEVDEAGLLWITPQENWNGRATVTAIADDQVNPPRDKDRNLRQIIGDCTIDWFRAMNSKPGEPSRDHVMEYSFGVIVMPVNDPPGSFDLVLPVEGYYASGEPAAVDFVWQSSPDVDGETIRYSLSFDFSFAGFDTSVFFRDIIDTSISVDLSEMLWNCWIYRSEHDTVLTAEWRVVARDSEAMIRSESYRNIVIALPLTIDDRSAGATPAIYSLSAFPNPFNSTVTISYSVRQVSKPVKLAIYDLSGRLVADLASAVAAPPVTAGNKDAVKHGGMTAERTVVWDAGAMPAGVYLVRLESGSAIRTIKTLLMK